MGYFHAMHHPYDIGSTVKIVSANYSDVAGKIGTVTTTTPEDCFDGEDCTYYLTLRGETTQYHQAFSFWDLEPVEEEQEPVPA